MAKKTCTVEVYLGRGRKPSHRWRLRAPNKKILATSSEGFISKSAAKRNLEAVTKAFSNAIEVEAPETIAQETKKAAEKAKKVAVKAKKKAVPKKAKAAKKTPVKAKKAAPKAKKAAPKAKKAAPKAVKKAPKKAAPKAKKAAKVSIAGTKPTPGKPIDTSPSLAVVEPTAATNAA